MEEIKNIDPMDEAIAEFKKIKREDLEREILEMFGEIVKKYKEYNPQGDYLSCSYVDETLITSNAYYGRDRENPVDAFVCVEGDTCPAGSFVSKCHSRDTEEEEDDE